MDIRTLLALLLSSLLFSACASKSIPTKYDDKNTSKRSNELATLSPSFILGIGTASEEMVGRPRQREVAIIKAMEDIARQLGVVVTSELMLSSNDRDKINDPDVNTFSMFTLTGRVVTARIVHSSYDKRTKELSVHMTADKRTLDLF